MLRHKNFPGEVIPRFFDVTMKKKVHENRQTSEYICYLNFILGHFCVHIPRASYEYAYK